MSYLQKNIYAIFNIVIGLFLSAMPSEEINYHIYINLDPLYQVTLGVLEKDLVSNCGGKKLALASSKDHR